MLWDWMSRHLSFLLLFHLPSSHNVFLHILYFSLSFLHIPSFFYIYVCLSIRNFWSPIDISFSTRLLCFFTLLFFPSYLLPFPASLFVLPLILSLSLPSSLPSTILILHYLLSFLFFLLPESQSSFSPLLNTYTCYQQWFWDWTSW